MGELLRLRGTRSIGSAGRTTKSGAFVCHEQNSVAYILATSLPLGLLLLEEEIHLGHVMDCIVPRLTP